MSLEGLIAVEKLCPDLPSHAAAGSLLVPYGHNSDGLLLQFTDRAPLGLQLDARHQRAFQGINVDGRHEPALVLKDWALWVDPESAYNTFQNTPKNGDAFLTKAGGHIGFVGTLDHATVLVTTDGKMINEPDWANDLFVGFRRWAVGYQDGNRRVNLLPLQDL